MNSKYVTLYFLFLDFKINIMTGNSTLVNIVMIIIVLHFVVGFVFLAKKLSGKPQEHDEDQNEET